jgi:hypothetical protein
MKLIPVLLGAILFCQIVSIVIDLARYGNEYGSDEESDENEPIPQGMYS